MSTIHDTGSHVTATPDTTHDAETNANSTLARRALATLRIAFGLTFLWAFFDKLLALGFATGAASTPRRRQTVDRFGDAAWIHGGSPTLGFLKFGADGPFDSFYHSIAGDAWVDWAFMLGPARHRCGADLRHRDADRRHRRRAAVPDDVDRRAAPRQQPGHRRTHPRRDQHGRPRGHQRRHDLGTRTPLGGDRAGEADPVPPLNLRSIGPKQTSRPPHTGRLVLDEPRTLGLHWAWSLSWRSHCSPRPQARESAVRHRLDACQIADGLGERTASSRGRACHPS